MLAQKLRQFLDEEEAAYSVVAHPSGRSGRPLHTAFLHSGTVMAKAFVVRAGVSDVLVVLPEFEELDLAKLSLVLEDGPVALEEEPRLTRLFPDCEPGAIPAVGRPYNLPCFVDETLLDWPEIIFDGGNPAESVKLSSDEYWRLAQAEIGDFKAHLRAQDALEGAPDR
jgi:Ala-tRNA(Pro) deacylase